MSNETTETKTAQVVALELNRFTTDGAERYGDLVYLFPADKARPSIWAAHYKQAINAALDEVEFDPNLDYVLLVGQIYPLSVLINVLTLRYRMFKVLVFNSTTREYQTEIFSND